MGHPRKMGAAIPGVLKHRPPFSRKIRDPSPHSPGKMGPGVSILGNILQPSLVPRLLFTEPAGAKNAVWTPTSEGQRCEPYLCSLIWLGRVCQDDERTACMEGLILTNLLKVWTISSVAFVPKFLESPTSLHAVASTTVAAVLGTGQKHNLSPPGACTAVSLTSGTSSTRKWNERSSRCMYCVFTVKMAASGREN